MGCGTSQEVKPIAHSPGSPLVAPVADEGADGDATETQPSETPVSRRRLSEPKLRKIESGITWEQTPSFTKRYNMDPVVEEQVRWLGGDAAVPRPVLPEQPAKKKAGWFSWK